MAKRKTETHVVKRYAGARLYDTVALAYATVQSLRALSATGVLVTVLDAATNEDVTRAILAA